MTIKLGLPSKGRLLGDAIPWFAKRGIAIEPAEGGREYAGTVSGADGLSIVMVAASEIPRELTKGRIHLGLTGRDLVEEKLPGHAQIVDEIARPGFGYADLVLAVPAFWIDVETIDDLDAVAAAFRQKARVSPAYSDQVSQSGSTLSGRPQCR